MEKLFCRSTYRYVCVVLYMIQTLNLAFLGLPQHPAYYVLIPYGVLLLGYEWYHRKLDGRNYSVTWLLLFLLCAAFSTFTSTYSETRSFLLLLLQGLIFLLAFAQEKGRRIYEMRQEMIRILKLVCVLSFLASFLSLLTFLFNISWMRNGAVFGLVGNRLFGVYFNCNPAAFLACMSICGSLLLLYLKSRFPYFHLANLIVQGTYVLLSNCRSAFLILLCLLMVVVYYILFKRRDYRRISNVLIALCVGFLAMFGGQAVKAGLFVIPQLQGAVFKEESRFAFDDVVELVYMIKEDPIGNAKAIYHLANDLSSRRVELYYDAYRLYRAHPITGIGLNNFQRMGQEVFYAEGLFAGSTIVHAHNLFLEVLVVSGTLGFLCFMIFLGQALVRMLENLRRYAFTPGYFIILLMSAMVSVEFAGSMLDYGVLYDYSLSALLFWIMLGYLFCINQNRKARLQRSSYAFELLSYRLLHIHYETSVSDEAVCAQVLRRECDDAYTLCIKFTAGVAFSLIYEASYALHVEKEEARAYEQKMAEELYAIAEAEISEMIGAHLPIMSISLSD